MHPLTQFHPCQQDAQSADPVTCLQQVVQILQQSQREDVWYKRIDAAKISTATKRVDARFSELLQDLAQCQSNVASATRQGNEQDLNGKISVRDRKRSELFVTLRELLDSMKDALHLNATTHEACKQSIEAMVSESKNCMQALNKALEATRDSIVEYNVRSAGAMGSSEATAVNSVRWS
jgi:hypothetical protein